MTLLQIAESDEAIERLKTFNQWLEYAANIANNYMPKNFTENMEWMEWKMKLIKFLKYQPGSNGSLLNYVIMENVAAIFQTNTKFIDDYVDSPTHWKSF